MDRNNNNNLRLILAIALSFLFIALYSYFFQKPNKTTTQTTKQETTNNHTATSPNAPNAQHFSVTQTIPQESLLSTISFEHARIEIDFLGRIKQVYLKDKKYLTPKQKGFLEHKNYLSSKEKREPP